MTTPPRNGIERMANTHFSAFSGPAPHAAGVRRWDVALALDVVPPASSDTLSAPPPSSSRLLPMTGGR